MSTLIPALLRALYDRREELLDAFGLSENDSSETVAIVIEVSRDGSVVMSRDGEIVYDTQIDIATKPEKEDRLWDAVREQVWGAYLDLRRRQ